MTGLKNITKGQKPITKIHTQKVNTRWRTTRTLGSLVLGVGNAQVALLALVSCQLPLVLFYERRLFLPHMYRCQQAQVKTRGSTRARALKTMRFVCFARTQIQGRKEIRCRIRPLTFANSKWERNC